jgi:phosphoenolpyruvate synthase/pyruvate phosphate dikinase
MIGRLRELPADQIGGKGLGLLRLMELGLPVPPAFVVPVAARGELAPEDRETIRELGEPMAVRSSAPAEDAADRSSAGQYESVMGVRWNDLADAVRRVYLSAASERVRAYRGAGAPPTDRENDPSNMAVVIQREVPSTRAGVAFSRDPLSGAPGTVVECVFGHGERLVSGLATPDRFRLGADDAVTARLAVKEGSHRLLRTLRDDEVVAVAGLAGRAERGFGHPVDVEFCFEGPRLWLLQCRAITGPEVGG